MEVRLLAVLGRVNGGVGWAGEMGKWMGAWIKGWAARRMGGWINETVRWICKWVSGGIGGRTDSWYATFHPSIPHIHALPTAPSRHPITHIHILSPLTRTMPCFPKVFRSTAPIIDAGVLLLRFLSFFLFFFFFFLSFLCLFSFLCFFSFCAGQRGGKMDR